MEPERPNYRTEYSKRALFFNRIIQDHFRNLAKECPSLDKLDQEIFDTLQANELKRIEAIRRNSFAWIAGFTFVLFIADSFVSSLHMSEPKYTLITSAIPIIFILAQIAYVSTWAKKYYEIFAARRLFLTICILERNSKFWSDSMFRKNIAARIDHVATAVEGIPLAYKGLAPEVRQELFAVSRSKAQALRRRELSIMIPEATTFTDLVNLLIENLCLLATGQWYRLPDEKYETRISRLLFTTYILGVALLGGGVITIVVFSSKIGVVAPILVTLLSAGALALLNKAGISVATIQKYTEVAAKIVPSDSSSQRTSK